MSLQLKIIFLLSLLRKHTDVHSLNVYLRYMYSFIHKVKSSFSFLNFIPYKVDQTGRAKIAPRYFVSKNSTTTTTANPPYLLTFICYLHMYMKLGPDMHHLNSFHFQKSEGGSECVGGGRIQKTIKKCQEIN